MATKSIGLPSAVFLWAAPLLILWSPLWIAALALARWHAGHSITPWQACKFLAPFLFAVLALFPGRKKIQKMYAPVLGLVAAAPTPAENGGK